MGPARVLHGGGLLARRQSARSPPRLFAGTTSWPFGPRLMHSDDLGASWQEPKRAFGFPPAPVPSSSASGRCRSRRSTRTSCGREPSRRPSSGPLTGGERSTSCRACGTTRTVPTGSPAPAPGHPHDPAAPGRCRRRDGRDVHRWGLSQRGQRGVPGTRATTASRCRSCRGRPRVRPVRAQGCRRRWRPRPDVRAEPRRRLTAPTTPDAPGPASVTAAGRVRLPGARPPRRPAPRTCSRSAPTSNASRRARGRASGAHAGRRRHLGGADTRGAREAYTFACCGDALCHDGARPLGVYVGTRHGAVWASTDEGESGRRSGPTCPRSSAYALSPSDAADGYLP